MPYIHTSIVAAGSSDIDLIARWRVAEFSSVLGGDVEAERATLAAFIAAGGNSVAVLAHCDGAPAGTCLLAPREIDPLHDVTPWLAGLYVLPAYRRLGVGFALVRAIETAARERGHARLYLYTDASEPYYSKRGWRTLERVDWKGFDAAFMVRDLTERDRSEL